MSGIYTQVKEITVCHDCSKHWDYKLSKLEWWFHCWLYHTHIGKVLRKWL